MAVTETNLSTFFKRVGGIKKRFYRSLPTDVVVTPILLNNAISVFYNWLALFVTAGVGFYVLFVLPISDQ